MLGDLIILILLILCLRLCLFVIICICCIDGVCNSVCKCMVSFFKISYF